MYVLVKVNLIIGTLAVQHICECDWQNECNLQTNKWLEIEKDFWYLSLAALDCKNQQKVTQTAYK